MSLPPAIIDQLLTGYLDEVLTADELVRVETLLKTEPSIAEELAKLQQMRSALKAVALADNDIRLDTGFANRVIDKAVVRARAEGVSDDHPLMRLDQQPMASMTPVPTSSTWRIAAVMVGLAASIAIAVVLMRPNEDGVVRVPDPQIVEVKPEMPVRVTPQGTELQPAINTSIASSQTGKTLVEPLSPSPMVEKPPGGGSQTPQPGVTSVATNPDLGTQLDSPSADIGTVEPEPPVAALGAIVVFNVELTDEGRERDAFNAAMKRAGLKLIGTKKISEEVVGSIEKSSLKNEDGASVVYMQAPAKDLDRLYLGLIADEVGVKSIGMSLAMNAPVMRAVNAVRQDPTKVRHESSSLQLLSDDDSLAQLTETLQKLEFMGMGNRQAVPSSGVDQMAEVLLLVK